MPRTIALAAAIAAAATAAPAQEVNVYSYRQPELIKPLIDAFTEKTGIEVNSVFIKEGLLERLRAEGDRSPADLVLTVDISRLTALEDAGLTQAVESEVLHENVPEAMRDDDGHWFGLTGRARLIYASKERVEPGEVTTYEDLASDKWEGRICTRSGAHSYTLGLIGAMIVHHGEDYTREWLQGVKDNLARKPQGGDRPQIRAVAAGECDIALGNTYYVGLMQTNEKDPEERQAVATMKVKFPTFENGGTHVNISGAALAKYAPNRDNGVRLIEYLSSDAAQQIY
ncbi:MAG TPA: extracellular solute-binding protein, partial [Paracoccaceae bacterium]|nr:extracellular solute-binding protein [Paracoccaceae bacterium]